MKIRQALARDEQGMGAVEFALIAPALIGFVIGISQLGLLFFAKADLGNAVAAGARLATVYPKPTDDAIKSAITTAAKDLTTAKLTTPTIAHDYDDWDREYADISVSYSVPIDFIIYKTPPITLTETRRVYMADSDFSPTTGTGSTSASSTSASSSTTSASSAGGTTTSASTSSTSTTSASTSTTSASSTSTTSASSSGNGHAHGNCNKKC